MEAPHGHADAYAVAHALDSEAGAERIPARAALRPAEALAVFAGGVIGALARSVITHNAPPHPDAWPWASFSVNMAGAALLGFAAARLARHSEPSSLRRAFVAAGLCGTLTTFSAMMRELLQMLDGGHIELALAYTAASIAGGLFLVTAAARLASGPPAPGAGRPSPGTGSPA